MLQFVFRPAICLNMVIKMVVNDHNITTLYDVHDNIIFIRYVDQYIIYLNV